jgi:hypothetical protein
MSRFGIIAVVGALVLGLSGGVAAHHSAIQFDFGNTVSVTGEVKRFRAMNPHMLLVLHVTDEKGSRDIEFEGHSTNNMYRDGYREGMISVGDRITVTIAPMRNGSDGGYVTGILTASGARIGARAPGAAAGTERDRAEGR